MEILFAPSLACHMMEVRTSRHGLVLKTQTTDRLQIGDPDPHLFEIPPWVTAGPNSRFRSDDRIGLCPLLHKRRSNELRFIADGLLALLPACWPVARSQFTTLNLSDSTHSPLTIADAWQLNLEAANCSDYFFEKPNAVQAVVTDRSNNASTAVIVIYL